MRTKIVVGLSLMLGACVSGGGEPPAPRPLAEDQAQPALALFEHVLKEYFAAAGAAPPTTCVMLETKALEPEQEEALIERFVRLAPEGRCITRGAGWRDTITDEPAQIIQVYDFACRSEIQCSGWAAVIGRPATRYAMSFENGAWRFTADPRLIAE